MSAKMDEIVEADGIREHLLAKHGGDMDQALREACWTIVMVDAHNVALVAAQEARQYRWESHGILRKGNAYKRPPAPPKAEPLPLDVAPDDAPHG